MFKGLGLGVLGVGATYSLQQDHRTELAHAVGYTVVISDCAGFGVGVQGGWGMGAVSFMSDITSSLSSPNISDVMRTAWSLLARVLRNVRLQHVSSFSQIATKQ